MVLKLGAPVMLFHKFHYLESLQHQQKEEIGEAPMQLFFFTLNLTLWGYLMCSPSVTHL